jgi:hypothetical protein
MKRHEVLAALAAAAGLTLAVSSAQAGLATGIARNAQPITETMVMLQQQVGENSDEALSQMIHLAKSSGHDRGGKSESGKGGSKSQGSDRSGNSKAKGGADQKGKSGDNHGHVSHGHGKGHGKGHGNGKGHGRGHDHPS